MSTAWPIRAALALLFLAGTGAGAGGRTRLVRNVASRTIASPLRMQAPVDAPERARSLSVGDMSKEIADVRARMMENDETRLMMQALRGSNINDDNAADVGVQMDVVEMRASNDPDDTLPLLFEPEKLKAYFAKRPMAVAKRVSQIVTKSAALALSIAWDSLTGNTEDIEVRRAADLRRTIISLGPFFIKLGQALSIRPDVLSPRAMVELQQLCDKVPSFDNELAMQTIREELKCADVSDVFSEITADPVAAASLGQVYRATLRESGDVVAVKVQRPFVLETVSLDLHLARELGFLARNFPALSKRLDLVELLDEFGSRFYAELDYEVECANGERIRREMAKMPMVVIPRNYPAFTSRRVHVAEWVDGEKLSQSTATDTRALVNLGVIVYLTQLLDSGFFHADPHPGNMLRTPDGRLVILDFGLMTEITDDQKYGMIEAIAHLIHRDYEKIGQDFVNLDFIPRGTDLAPIIPALSRVFDAALAGGGAKSINFQELAADLAQITFDYPFRIPPYFALVIRAIGVLEGIALVGNPDFAIVDEAYPYISKRLLTDESPRLRAALKYMVYGRGDTFDVDRMIDLLQALEKFISVRDTGDGSAYKVDGVRGATDLGKAGSFSGTRTVVVNEHAVPVGGGLVPERAAHHAALPPAQHADAAPAARAGLVSEASTRQALTFFFSREGRPFREFLLDEVTKSVDAISRDAIGIIIASVGLRGRTVPPLVLALAPPVTATDRKVIDNITRLVQFLLGDFNQAEAVTATVSDRARQARELQSLVPVLREFAPAMREFGLLIVTRLAEKQATRAFAWARESIERR